MKVTFIRPNMHDQRSKDAMEPLVFAILKSLTPDHIETVLYDERLEEIPYDEPTDLVAMTVETYTARRSYQIAAKFRARGVKVVMGGYHPTFLPDEVLQYADAVVQGDAEGLWTDILEDAQNGCLKPLYSLETFAPLDNSCPDRSIFAGKNYNKLGMVQYGRGCKFNCDFCSIRAFYGKQLRQRPVKDVVAEIERLGTKHVFLVDDNIFVNIPKAKELFTALIPLNIQWTCQVSLDVTKDAELMDLMRRSGCLSAVVGFESLNVDNLKQMNKKWNHRFGGYDKPIKIMQDAGIMIYGTFVFGYDHDTVEAFDEAVQFSIDHKFFLANFNPLTPTPKAPLMDRLREEGRLIHDKWWLDPDYRYGHATFHPKGMTAEELTEGCYQARSKFYRYSSIGQRVWDRRTSLRSPYRAAFYSVANLISRKEIHSKQDLALGGKEPLVPVRAPVSSTPNLLQVLPA